MTVDNTKKQNILIVHNYYQIPGGEDTVVFLNGFLYRNIE